MPQGMNYIRVVILSLLLFCGFTANAQLVADFASTNFGGDTLKSGCSPLILVFRDSSTINGASIPYRSIANGDAFNSHLWDFDQAVGGVSTRQNPTFGFVGSGTYLVSLSVSINGGTYVTYVDTVTVFPSPTVDFTVDQTSGCDPLTVCFTNLTNSGGLNLTDTLWDMGDGFITTAAAPCHTFFVNPQATQRCFDITLIVTNDQGCTGSETKADYICIDPPPVANFVASDTALCGEPYITQFFDSTNYIRPLTYVWDFGDGVGTSILQNPIYQYATDGFYTVTLTVSDTVCGLSSTITKTDYIRTQDLLANFGVDTLVACAGVPLSFTDSSLLGIATSATYSWDFGNGVGTSIQQNPSYAYPDSGTFFITLTITDNFGCTEDTTLPTPVTILPVPIVDFTADVTASCQAPLAVNFSDLSSADVVSWDWLLNSQNGDGSILQDPSYTYQAPGNYPITLTVTNNVGCTATLTRPSYIDIDPTVVSFQVDSAQGCIPLSVNFTDQSTSVDPIISYQWDFDDPSSGANNFSTLPNPNHVFNDVGTYNPSLTIVTQSGCMAMFDLIIRTGDTSIANFIATPLSICVNEVVTFTNFSTGTFPNTIYNWSFGDGQTAMGQGPVDNTYEDPGLFQAQLELNNNGCRVDTSIEIEVLDPLAAFDAIQDCAMPGTVNFTDQSTGADTWNWQFGLNNDSSIFQNPTYVFPATGTYSVTLTVTSTITGCSDDLIEDIDVSFTTPQFSANLTQGCAPLTVDFSSTSIGTGLSSVWDFGDPASGANNIGSGVSPMHTFNNPGDYTIRLTVTDITGCQYIEEKIAYISVSGVNVDFDSPVPFGCLPPGGQLNVSFNDNSVPFNSAIVDRIWDFGDGTPAMSLGPNPIHPYTVAGLYDVTLIAENSFGCFDTLVRPSYVDVNQPIADFETGFNLYCSQQSIPFINRSTGDGLTYQWDFGDLTTNADTSIIRNPSYAYPDSGNYDVTVIITDRYGCMDTAEELSFINIAFPSINFSGDDTFNFCPPHLVNFTEFITFDTINVLGPPNGVLWDFGDNSFSSIPSPSHIYTQAGLFDIRLIVNFVNGCSDTLIRTDYVSIGGALGNITIDEDTGCLDHTVFLDANSFGAVNHFWLFGDGGADAGEDTISYTYTSAGIYSPAVILTDTQIPSCTYTLESNDTVVVDTVYAGFLLPGDTVCQNLPVQFTDTSTAEVIPLLIDWLWDFGDGTTDTVQNPIHTFTTAGDFIVRLTVTNLAGCSDDFLDTISVRQAPQAIFSVSDSIGCDTLIVNVVDLSVSGGGAITSWEWDFNDPNNVADEFSVQSPPPYTYTDTGTYIIQLVVEDVNGCPDTMPQKITVYESPLGIPADTLTICRGDTIVLEGDTIAVIWDWTPGIYLSDSTIARPNAYPFDTTTYTLFVEDAEGCQTLDDIVINVIPLPQLAVTPFPDTTICIGDTLVLNALSPNAVNYVWSPALGLTAPFQATTQAIPPVSTVYRVFAGDVNGCRSQDSIDVTVSNLQADALVERTCLGDNTNFIDISTFTDLTIQSWTWDFGDPTTTADISNQPSPNYLYPDSGSYIVSLTIEDAIGCQSIFSDTVIVDHPAQPVAFSDTTICFGESASLFAQGGTNIFWEPASSLDTAGGFSVIATPEFTTTYSANITNGVCPFEQAEVEVVVEPTPEINTIDDTEITRGTTIRLETQVSFADSTYWSPPDSLSCVNCESPVARPLQDITYTVSSFNTEFGCFNADTVNITVVEFCNEDQVFVGNSFTPNGDGVNDQAFARLYGLESINFYRVFDRWGNLMFETESESIGWNGTDLEGKKLNSAAFVYVVEANCFNGTKVLKKGNVTILK